jgi:hypothetical protein
MSSRGHIITGPLIESSDMTANDLLGVLKEKFDKASNTKGYEHVEFCIPNNAYEMLFEQEKSLRKYDKSYDPKSDLKCGDRLHYIYFSVYPYSEYPEAS